MSVPTRPTYPTGDTRRTVLGLRRAGGSSGTASADAAAEDGSARTAAGWTSSLAVRLTGAALALGICVVHIVDQGGLPGDKTPRYVGIGYWLVELAAVAVAILLLSTGSRQRLAGWLLAAGVAAGPFVGYVLSRGPGLPGYTDDRGNWTEPIGLSSLALELALVALAVPAVLALFSSLPARGRART